MYSRTIKIYQGIDNPIHIVTKNQEQKPVDLTDYDVQVEIQDPENAVTVQSFTVDFIAQDKGLGVFTIPLSIVNSLEQRHYELTAKLILLNDNSESPAYIDDNYGVKLPLQVLPAYYSTSPTEPQTYSEGVIDAGVIGQ